MRKLKLQLNTSIDGFIAGPNGEMDWMTWNWDDKLKQHVSDLTDSIGTIIMGRKMAGGFIEHWAATVANPADPNHPFGKIMMDTPKVVFTKTLTRSEWENTTIATGDITAEVNKLKQQDGKDIMAYGGAGFAASLIKARLIDEFHLFLNPCAIGKGMAIFNELEGRQHMTLVKATQFDCGIVGLQYTPNK